MKKLVFATHNRDKYREMSQALEGFGWQILAGFDFPGVPDVIEDGRTLEENSLKKAKEISVFTGLATLSDDTGLFIDALNGEPGIYAARFAGEKCSYSDNVEKVLRLMKDIPLGQRRAVFRTVITIYDPASRKVHQVSGEVEGLITGSVQGNGGFGYDPIFLPKGYSKVFASMSLEEKNQVSHRGRALQEARQLLPSL